MATAQARVKAGPGQVDPLQPHLTESGRAHYKAREREACGEMQLTLRVRAVATAHGNGDWKMLSGALDDLAAVAVAWGDRVRAERRRSYA